MIGVEPVTLFLRQQRRFQATGIDRAQGQGFELEELAELALARFPVQHQVFDTHAPTARTVGPWLDGGDHPRLHGGLRRRHRLIGDHLRAFVHIEEVTDTMAGTMPVIHAFGPDRRPGDGVQQRRKNAARELRTGQGDHALEHPRAIAFLLGRRRAHRHHPGNVGGTAQVLAAGVDQQQAVALDQRMLRLGGVIVRHRPIGVEAGNGIEAQRHIPRTSRTGGGEAFVDGQLGDRLATQRGLQPGKEFTQRSAVLLHGLADMHRIVEAFAGLGQGRRVQPFDQGHLLAKVIQQADRHPRRVDQQARPRRHAGQYRADITVVTQGHAIGLEHLRKLGTHLVQGHEQRGLLLADQGKGNEHRVEGHVGTAQVEQPGDIVQRGDEVPVGTAVFQFTAQLHKLLATADRRLRRQVLVDRLVRQRVTVFPDHAQQVEVSAQLRAAGLQLVLQGPRRRQRHDRAIHRDHTAWRGLFGQPVQRTGEPRRQLHQLDATAGQLLGRLLPVAAIRPDAGELRRHDQGTDRALET